MKAIRTNKSRLFFTLILLAVLSVLITGCPAPEIEDFMTPAEIVKYMNKNFQGEFEIETGGAKWIDEDWWRGWRVKMKCEYEGKTFYVTTEDMAHNIEFGWRHYPLATNYYTMRYADEIKAKIPEIFDSLNDSYFAEGDYKINVTFKDDCDEITEKYKYNSVDEFLKEHSRYVRFELILRGDFLNDKDFKSRFSSFYYDLVQYSNSNYSWGWFEYYIVNTKDDISELDSESLMDKYERYEQTTTSSEPLNTKEIYFTGYEYFSHYID